MKSPIRSRRWTAWLAVTVLCAAASGCGSSVPDAAPGKAAAVPTPIVIDRTCDHAPFPSLAWTQCEAQNFAKTLEAPAEQAAQPGFTLRELDQSVSNIQDLIARDTADLSWIVDPSPLSGLAQASLQADLASLFSSLQQVSQSVQQNPASPVLALLNSAVTPVAASYALSFAGDPYRYPQSSGADGKTFYDNEALVTPVVFYDSGCARLSGHVWQPRPAAGGGPLPGVIVESGSFGAPETLLWWAAQLLARNGYVVLSFDPRGQGRSDLRTPGGEAGSNANPGIFWTGLVDAIDFFRSSPGRPYPNNPACRGAYPTVVAPYNPAYAAVDPDRLGIAGHSAGALGVSIVQGYGAPGASPWPGQLDRVNPVKAAVGWDGIADPASGLPGNAVGGGTLTLLTSLPLVDQLLSALMLHGYPPIVPRVPLMSQDSEYGVLPTPYLLPPPPLHNQAKFSAWTAAAVPWYELTIRGSTHLEWSLAAGAPATSWCPDAASGRCSGGWGNAMAQHYTLAWFDRWLKKPGEPGYADADTRLVDDGGPQGGDKFSYRFQSGRNYPDRSGHPQVCADIRAGC